MTKVTFGTLRFIELFSDDDTDNLSYDSYMESFRLKELAGKNYKVIGAVNGMEPILEIKHHDKKSIEVHSSRENQFIILANSKEEFLKILSRIDNIWMDHKTEMFLPRSSGNMSLFKEFVKDIKKIPGIDFGYWIDFAFKELDIRYEV